MGADPRETVIQLAKALSDGDLDGAMALYEPDAHFMAEPGKILVGPAIRDGLAGFLALKPILTMVESEVIETGDLALYLGRWDLVGSDPEGRPVHLSGLSTDVLRRHADGSWKIVIDNPWGTAVLA